MIINDLMYSERKIFLNDDQSDGNKGNGYRFASKSGIGSKLQFKIPRDRLEMFRPVILGLLNQQEEQVKDLCFELYGKGLTTRQIENVISKIYATSYSNSSLTNTKLNWTFLNQIIPCVVVSFHLLAVNVSTRAIAGTCAIGIVRLLLLDCVLLSAITSLNKIHIKGSFAFYVNLSSVFTFIVILNLFICVSRNIDFVDNTSFF